MERKPRYGVVIGGSHGFLIRLTDIIKHLDRRPELPLTILVANHYDGASPLEPIKNICNNRHVSPLGEGIPDEDGVYICTREYQGVAPSSDIPYAPNIDVVMRTAARVFTAPPNRFIPVIITGFLDDGAESVAQITHESNTIAIAEDPETIGEDGSSSMPYQLLHRVYRHRIEHDPLDKLKQDLNLDIDMKKRIANQPHIVRAEQGKFRYVPHSIILATYEYIGPIIASLIEHYQARWLTKQRMANR